MPLKGVKKSNLRKSRKSNLRKKVSKYRNKLKGGAEARRSGSVSNNTITDENCKTFNYEYVPPIPIEDSENITDAIRKLSEIRQQLLENINIKMIHVVLGGSCTLPKNVPSNGGYLYHSIYNTCLNIRYLQPFVSFVNNTNQMIVINISPEVDGSINTSNIMNLDSIINALNPDKENILTHKLQSYYTDNDDCLVNNMLYELFNIINKRNGFISVVDSIKNYKKKEVVPFSFSENLNNFLNASYKSFTIDGKLYYPYIKLDLEYNSSEKEISPILQSKHNLKSKPQNVIYLPTYTRFMIFDNLNLIEKDGQILVSS